MEVGGRPSQRILSLGQYTFGYAENPADFLPKRGRFEMEESGFGHLEDLDITTCSFISISSTLLARCPLSTARGPLGVVRRHGFAPRPWSHSSCPGKKETAEARGRAWVVGKSKTTPVGSWDEVAPSLDFDERTNDSGFVWQRKWGFPVRLERTG